MESATSGSPTTSSPDSNGLGSLIQGALETSNVNVVEELSGTAPTGTYELSGFVTGVGQSSSDAFTSNNDSDTVNI